MTIGISGWLLPLTRLEPEDMFAPSRRPGRLRGRQGEPAMPSVVRSAGIPAAVPWMLRMSAGAAAAMVW
jgi:hypothetical protein